MCCNLGSIIRGSFSLVFHRRFRTLNPYTKGGFFLPRWPEVFHLWPSRIPTLIFVKDGIRCPHLVSRYVAFEVDSQSGCHIYKNPRPLRAETIPASAFLFSSTTSTTYFAPTYNVEKGSICKNGYHLPVRVSNTVTVTFGVVTPFLFFNRFTDTTARGRRYRVLTDRYIPTHTFHDAWTTRSPLSRN